MGLAEVKRKQRLIGSARTNNAAWTNDATLPGQRLLASMGWQAGQGIGHSRTGMTAPVQVALKLDNKGIGAHRMEREAKASGQAMGWIGGGGDLGSLFDRLNAEAAAAASAAVTSEEESSAGETSEREAKRQRKEEKRAKKAAKEAAKAAKKASKKAQKAGAAVETVEESASASPSDPASPLPAALFNPRMASRGKYLRAKRMVGNDLASVNEILGIASTSATPLSPSPAPASPAPLSDHETRITPIPPKPSSLGKRKADEKQTEAVTTASDAKKQRKAEKEEKRRLKEERRAKKKAPDSAQKSDGEEDDQIQPTLPPIDPSLDPSFQGTGNTVSQLSVQQYLSNRLILRKAEIKRRKQAQEQGIWSRAAAIGA